MSSCRRPQYNPNNVSDDLDPIAISPYPAFVALGHQGSLTASTYAHGSQTTLPSHAISPHELPEQTVVPAVLLALAVVPGGAGRP